MASPPDLAAVLEAIGWARSRLAGALSAPVGSRERRDALLDLRRAVGEARDLLERYPGRAPGVARALLRVVDFGLARLTRSP